MADEAEVEEEQESGKGRGLLPLLGVGGLMLVVGLGGGAVIAGVFDDSPEAADAGGGNGTEGEADPALAIMPSTQVVTLGSFTINLRDSAGGRLLQMDLSVECDGESSGLVKPREAQLRDSIIMLASDYSYLELEGTDGRLRLRDEAHRRINAVLAPEKCSRVYFTKFVVQ
jgi:flagellar basal body-associated protein FliL